MMLLRLVMLLRLLLLMVLLFARRIERLRLRGIGLADLRLFVTVVIAIIGAPAARLLLEIGLALAELLLRGGDQTEIMLGVLVVIFRCDRVTRTLRVAGKLEIFLRDVRGGAANLDVLPVRFIDPRQRILVVMATLAIATTHPFILTVSHDSFFHQPRSLQRHCRRSSLTVSNTGLRSGPDFAQARTSSNTIAQSAFRPHLATSRLRL